MDDLKRLPISDIENIAAELQLPKSSIDRVWDTPKVPFGIY